MAKSQEKQSEGEDVLALRDWFAGKEAGMVARRNEVFALLGHYHNTQVKPHLTVRGALKRLWWRVTGQKYQLLDWWELFDARKAEIALRRQVRLQLEGELANEPIKKAPSKIIT